MIEVTLMRDDGTPTDLETSLTKLATKFDCSLEPGGIVTMSNASWIARTAGGGISTMLAALCTKTRQLLTLFIAHLK